MSKSYRQGIYTPINPEKYKGNVKNIVYRSSWERAVLSWLDRNSNCISFSSEEIVIPYFSPFDNKMHRYYPDILATFKQKDGSVRTVLIEIKPYNQTLPPKSNKNKRILTEQLTTYHVNQLKWAAAIEHCKRVGWDFKVITENEIFAK